MSDLVKIRNGSIVWLNEKGKTLSAGEKNILIVGGDTESRNTVHRLAESLGYLCTETGTADAALALMEKTHFPIVIANIVTLKEDGLKLLQVTKEQYPGVDVLTITGSKSKYSPLEIVQAGAADFLARPFGMDQLGARLHKMEQERTRRNLLYLSAIGDPLTGLFNRRYFCDKLKQEIERARRQKHPLSIIMADVNEFKEFNDRYGHVAGDALLQTVAKILQRSVREYVDIACRYGGDEFVVILPETDEKRAVVVRNRIKKNFNETPGMGGALSVGVAELREELDREMLIRLADKRMYTDKSRSKARSRDKVPHAMPTTS